MKEHTFQMGRECSRLRYNTGEGPQVAKKCGLKNWPSVKLEFVDGGEESGR